MAGQMAGEGVSQALQFLAQNKAQEMAAQKQQQRQGQFLEALGLPAALAGAPPGIANALVKQVGQQQMLAQFQQMFGEGGGQQELTPQEQAVFDLDARSRELEGRGPLAAGLGEGLAGQAASQLQASAQPQQPVGIPAQRARQAEETYNISEEGEVVGPEGAVVADWYQQEPERRVTAAEVAAAGAIHPAAAKGLELQERRAAQNVKNNIAREQHDFKRNQKWIEETQNAAENGRNDLQMIEVIESELQNVGPMSRASIANLIPQWGPLKQIRNWVRSPSQSAFETAQKGLLGALKDTFGARPTNFDVGLMLDMFPKIGQSETANRMSTRIMRATKYGAVKRNEIYDSLREKNPRASETQLRRLTGKVYKKWADKEWNLLKSDLRMIKKGQVPMEMPNGQKGYVPQKQVEKALASGARYR